MTLKHKFALCYFNVKLWATYIIPQEGNWEERDLDVERTKCSTVTQCTNCCYFSTLFCATSVDIFCVINLLHPSSTVALKGTDISYEQLVSCSFYNAKVLLLLSIVSYLPHGELILQHHKIC